MPRPYRPRTFRPNPLRPGPRRGGAPLLLASLAALAACSSTKEAPADRPAAPATPADRAALLLSEGKVEEAHAMLSDLLADQRLVEARERLARGDARGALAAHDAAVELSGTSPESEALRTQIEALVLQRALAEGRRELESGDPRDAMLPLDEAVRVAPADAELRFLRACATLRMGIEDGDAILFEDALRNASRAARSGERPAAWYALAQAEFQLYADGDPARIARALAAVRRGDAARDAGSPDEALLPEPPERIATKVLGWAASLAANGQLVDEDVPSLCEEWRGHASAWVGIAPEEAWGWNQVALSHERAGEYGQARDAARRGVMHAPEDAPLHETLTRSARALSGEEGVLEVYAGLARDYPESPACRYGHGMAAFEVGVAALQSERADRADLFLTAEGAFRAARAADAQYAQRAIGYEVVSRAGQGWSHVHAGRLDAARDAFLSMEDLLEGGLRWKLEGRMDDGVRGLEFVVFGYNQRWADESLDDEERLRSLEKAASLSSTLHAYAPDSGKLANDAGFFHRDAGVALNDVATSIVTRVTSAEDMAPEERERRLSVARDLVRRAEEHMRTSYAAYVEAVRLEPDNARTVNDCGLVQVYYLRDDVDAAESYLMDAKDAAQAALTRDDLDDEQRYAVENALGDAYENLGFLELSLRKRPIVARNWFEKSQEIGPDPRPIIDTVYLPLCKQLERDEVSDAEIDAAYGWPVAVPE